MITCRKEINALKAYVPGKPIDDAKKEYGLEEVIKLASNENPIGCSPKAIEAAKKSLETASVYPDGNCTLLRQCLANKLNVTEDSLVFGAGSDEVISLIATTFVGQGDEAITCTPTFSQYASAVRQIGGKMIEVPLVNHTYDLDGLLDKITDKTKALFISNPNNPTGTIITAKQQLDFISKVPKDVLIVFDEAYNEYIDDDIYPDTIPLLHNYDNIMILRTFSKIYGLASFRIGYGIAKPELIELINRVRGPFNVTTSAQAAALASIEDNHFKKTTVALNAQVKAFTYKKCEELGLDYIPSYGNFLMIDFKKPSLPFFEQLLKKGFIVRPGFYFGMDTYQRVTIGTMEQMERFFRIVSDLI